MKQQPDKVLAHTVMEPARLEAGPPTRPPPPGRARRVAALVVHGMGQQRKFETLEQAVEGVLRAAPPERVRIESGQRLGVRAVRIGDTRMRRVELQLERAQLHVHEAHWADETEGKVGMRDVLLFLARGAGGGLRNALFGIHRWMFGRSFRFPRRPFTLVSLALATGILLSVAWMNVLVLVAAAPFVGGPRTLPEGALSDATKTMLLFLISLAAVWAWIKVARGAREASRALRRMLGRPPPRETSLAMRALLAGAWIVLGAALAVAVGAAAFAAYIVARGLLRPDAPALTSPVPTWLMFGLWPALLAATYALRGAFVQYVGDVAAYVNTRALDRFEDVRHEIRRIVKEQARALYAARAEDGSPEYDAVCVVGHSLGSVVAYDALNALLQDDLLAPDAQRLGVAQRTALLLTFGSPLDKTAFVFAAQARSARGTREAVASLGQPLIQSYDHRPFPWVNVHSRADVISGALHFYDDPDAPEHQRVDNVEDPEATTPFLAHVEFWENHAVWSRVRAAANGPDDAEERFLNIPVQAAMEQRVLRALK